MLSTKKKESIEILRRIGWGYKRIKKLLSREKVNVPQWVLELLQGGK